MNQYSLYNSIVLKNLPIKKLFNIIRGNDIKKIFYWGEEKKLFNKFVERFEEIYEESASYRFYFSKKSKTICLYYDELFPYYQYVIEILEDPEFCLIKNSINYEIPDKENYCILDCICSDIEEDIDNSYFRKNKSTEIEKRMKNLCKKFRIIANTKNLNQLDLSFFKDFYELSLTYNKYSILINPTKTDMQAMEQLIINIEKQVIIITNKIDNSNRIINKPKCLDDDWQKDVESLTLICNSMENIKIKNTLENFLVKINQIPKEKFNSTISVTINQINQLLKDLQNQSISQNVEDGVINLIENCIKFISNENDKNELYNEMKISSDIKGISSFIEMQGV